MAFLVLTNGYGSFGVIYQGQVFFDLIAINQESELKLNDREWESHAEFSAPISNETNCLFGSCGYDERIVPFCEYDAKHDAFFFEKFSLISSDKLEGVNICLPALRRSENIVERLRKKIVEHHIHYILWNKLFFGLPPGTMRVPRLLYVYSDAVEIGIMLGNAFVYRYLFFGGEPDDWEDEVTYDGHSSTLAVLDEENQTETLDCRTKKSSMISDGSVFGWFHPQTGIVKYSRVTFVRRNWKLDDLNVRWLRDPRFRISRRDKVERYVKLFVLEELRKTDKILDEADDFQVQFLKKKIDDGRLSYHDCSLEVTDPGKLKFVGKHGRRKIISPSNQDILFSNSTISHVDEIKIHFSFSLLSKRGLTALLLRFTSSDTACLICSYICDAFVEDFYAWKRGSRITAPWLKKFLALDLLEEIKYFPFIERTLSFGRK
jgi:hypothetical protein